MHRPSGQMAGPYETGPTVLVGRSRERVFLREELAEAIAGHGRLILLGGEAGIGKTTLAKDLALEAGTRGAFVLAGHCYDLTNAPPYGPWLDLVARYRPSAELPPPPAAFAEGKFEGITSQAALFADIRRFVADLALAHPVVLILEDLHWADPASLDLLRYIAPLIRMWPLLLVVTYRVDELTRRHPFSQQLPALVRESDGLRLDLRRLDAGALDSLVSTSYPLTPEDTARLVSYLERHAEGNPFFAIELLRTLQEDDLLRPEDDRWVLAEFDRIVLPPLLRQIIDGRVARLGEDTRQVLAMAAVIGQEVPLDLWAAVAGIGDDKVMAIVEQAVDAHLQEAARDGTRVRFVHALTREALYEGIFPPRRRTWHLRVAEAMVADTRVDPDAVAFHFQQAGDARAVDWLIRSGERAQRAYAWRTATDRFRAAADLLHGVEGEERTRAWLLYRLARLQRFASPLSGIDDLNEAERLVRIVDEPVLTADILYSRGLLRCYSDDFDLGLVEMGAGIDALEVLPLEAVQASNSTAAWLADALPATSSTVTAGDDPAVVSLHRAGLHHRRGGHPWFLAAAGHLQEAVNIGERFVAAVEDVPAPGGLVRSATGHAFHGLGIAYANLDRPDAARLAFANARAIYRELDHHAVIAFTLLTELRDVALTFGAADPTERRRLAAEAELAITRAGGAVAPDVSPRIAWLGCLALAGEWDEALEIARETALPGNTCLRREIIVTLAALARERGEPEVAWSHILNVLPAGPATQPGCRHLQEALTLQRLAADLCLDAGDLDGARAWLETHGSWLDWSGALLGRAEDRLAWARYHLTAGDTRSAGDDADAALALAADPPQPQVLTVAHRVMGECAIDLGRPAPAMRHLEASLDLADACASPFERASTLLSLAVLRSRTDQIAVVEPLLGEVNAIAGRLGAVRVIDRAGALAERLTKRPAVVYPAGLTQREVDVLRLVADGLTDAAVADQLSISPRTVGQHLRSVYAKLNVSSRAAATRFAVEQRLT